MKPWERLKWAQAQKLTRGHTSVTRNCHHRNHPNPSLCRTCKDTTFLLSLHRATDFRTTQIGPWDTSNGSVFARSFWTTARTSSAMRLSRSAMLVVLHRDWLSWARNFTPAPPHTLETSTLST